MSHSGLILNFELSSASFRDSKVCLTDFQVPILIMTIIQLLVLLYNLLEFEAYKIGTMTLNGVSIAIRTRFSIIFT